MYPTDKYEIVRAIFVAGIMVNVATFELNFYTRLLFHTSFDFHLQESLETLNLLELHSPLHKILPLITLS